jgi:hypothetical protein
MVLEHWVPFPHGVFHEGFFCKKICL